MLKSLVCESNTHCYVLSCCRICPQIIFNNLYSVPLFFPFYVVYKFLFSPPRIMQTFAIHCICLAMDRFLSALLKETYIILCLYIVLQGHHKFPSASNRIIILTLAQSSFTEIYQFRIQTLNVQSRGDDGREKVP